MPVGGKPLFGYEEPVLLSSIIARKNFARSHSDAVKSHWCISQRAWTLSLWNILSVTLINVLHSYIYMYISDLHVGDGSVRRVKKKREKTTVVGQFLSY